MHEYSIATSLLEIALRTANEHGLKKVSRARVQAGALRSIVPSQLTFWWEAITKGTPAEGAALDIETMPLRSRCRACGHEFDVEQMMFRCPRCDGTHLDTLTGMELLLTEIEGD